MSEYNLLENRFPGRRAALKREILEQALLCFNEFGIEATTIDIIKARCQTSVGAIYHHFGNKEGLLRELFFAALDDQQQYLAGQLTEADSLCAVVHTIVTSYVDWVEVHPEWARFQFQARSAVAKGPYEPALKEKNAQNYQGIKDKLLSFNEAQTTLTAPFEILASLVVGPSENYCRAWLAGRVKTAPSKYRQTLAQAAWRSLQE